MKIRTKIKSAKVLDEVLTSTLLQKALSITEGLENGEPKSTKIENITTI